jgi:hypothetical protein
MATVAQIQAIAARRRAQGLRNAATGRLEADVFPANQCGFCDVCEGPTEHGVRRVDRQHTERS